MTKTTKEERNEIRLLEARATMGPWLPSESIRVPKVLDRDGGLVCEFDTVNGTNDREAVAAMRNIFPDLLADLDAAEAERDATEVESNKSITALRYTEQMLLDARAQRDRAESELDAERRMRVEAEAASDRMVAERDAFRQERDDLLAMRGEAEDEADYERDALRAKLAALVAAVDTEIDNVDHENYPLCGVHDGSRLIGRHLNGAECTCGVQKIRNAIAAARGGA